MSHYPRQDQKPHQALHDLVGGPASSWLEDPTHSGFPGNNGTIASKHTMWTSLLHMMTYMVLITVLMVWAGKHYLRHQRRHQQHGHTEEVIFVLGIPLLIPTTNITSGMPSPRSRIDREDSPITGGSDGGHTV